MKSPLQQRVATALAALTLGAAGLLGALLWGLHQKLEAQTLSLLLGRELEALIASGARADQLDPATTGLRYFRPAQAPYRLPPREVVQMPPGSYHGLRIGDSSDHHLLVRALPQGEHVYLLYDISDLRERERRMALLMAVGSLLIALCVWLLARRVARGLVQPLVQLIERMAALQPGDARHLLHEEQTAELAPVVAALNRHLAEIERLLQHERAFAAAAGHELRTPLAAIASAAELLTARGVDAPELARMQRNITAAAQSLDAIATLATARSLPPAQPLALHEALPRMAEPYLHAAQAEGTQVAWALTPVTVQAAEGIIAILFTNLLRNALRASAGGRVSVHLDGQSLTVSDDGPGMDAEQIARACEPGITSARGGSGIGLYIARELAIRLGWTLHLSPAQGGGLRASLHFPPPKQGMSAAHPEA